MHEQHTHYSGQWLLLALIQLYQRFLSGRLFFRRVRCTFENTESCSRYGERIVRSVATNLFMAIALILRRLRRCRSASIYRDEHGWLWGPLYDGPDGGVDAGGISKAMKEAHETAASQTMVLKSAAIVAAHCGDHGAATQCMHQARALTQTEVRPLARNGGAIAKSMKRQSIWRLLWLLGLAATSLASIWICTSSFALGVAAAIPGAALALWSMGTYADRRKRFMDLQAANRFYRCCRADDEQ